ncbi:MAG: hypothetical protein IJK02_01135 [Clostridia bacterium]|nr:hypothetical protein [Clostridia bacterium]
MNKKGLALLLALIMALALPLTAFAASTDAPAAADPVDTLSDALVDEIAPAAEDLTIASADADLAGIVAAYSVGDEAPGATMEEAEAAGLTDTAAPAESAEGQTVGEAAAAMKKYIFMKVEDPAAIAAMIADGCSFTYALVEDSKGTVYIQVDIEKNPQIFNYEVFRDLVDELYAREKEVMAANSDGSVDYLMAYEHIAGELAMHAIMYAATNEIIRLTGIDSGKIVDLYNAARVADLDYNESRLPGGMIIAFGKLIIALIRWNFFKILTIFG